MTTQLDQIREALPAIFYRPNVANPLSPAKFVHKIKVPVFLAC